ncbi:MAG: Vi polysaccharide biosynthesis protein VipB/TviC [Bacteroidetes bacterium RBG_19FT_COMBO_42_7]|nr:MAG: Vi polysaccharide biosynthesis protein VipB/TviC [Bacteroidetes bacterium RBG_13_42_15]OFY74624.1 MAG: Vi polysaccharide biosynthesis protein VipB/TviC [Bacteroidetes bacterium RBG_19FT_COMBO_42_7]
MNRIVSGQKVLITGGAGFIGSNLVESMLNAGNHVVCLDNFSTGKRENIRGFMDNPDFRLIEGDIRNYQDCEKSVKGIDFVFHQAALGSVPRSVKDPVTSTDVNIGGFVKMLYASKEAKVRRFIYAASSSTYGDHTDLPKVEEKIGKPLSPYGITKYVDELFAANFAALYNIEVIGLRYFNVFGRRQDPQGAYAAVIPLFVEKLLRHEPPVINGDGSYSRDFTYIDNVLQANHLAALAKDQPAVNQVYNVAYGDRTSLIELFELVRNLIAGFDSEVMGINPVYETVRAGDIPHSLASIGKAKRLLGYNPTHTVREGLAEAIQWYRENL